MTPRSGITLPAGAAAIITRHTTIYGTGSVLSLSLSLVSVFVLTRFLTPTEFGTLGLALVASSFLTIALNAVLLQGSLMYAFGGEMTEDGEDGQFVGADERRRRLGTALSVTIVAAVTSLAVTVMGALILGALTGLSTEGARLAVLAAASGGAGAIWRLISSIPRMQRRPTYFIWLSCIRPALVLAATVLLMVSGGGVLAAMTAVVAGTFLANVIAVTLFRRTLTPCVDRTSLKSMALRSVQYTPLLGGYWVIQNADLFVVAAMASGADAGHYRLASRLGAFSSYVTSAFLSAWMPLQGARVVRDLYAKYGRREVHASALYYFSLLCITIMLGMALVADGIVAIASPAYSGAAGLVIPLSLAFVCHGIVVMVYRTTTFPKRPWVYRAVVAAGGAIYVPLTIAGVTRFGPAGAAYSTIVVLVFIAAFLYLRSSLVGNALPVPLLRLVSAVAAAVTCWWVAGLGVPGSGPSVALHIAALPGFFCAVVVTLPRSHRKQIRSVLAEALRRRGSVGVTGPGTPVTPDQVT